MVPARWMSVTALSSHIARGSRPRPRQGFQAMQAADSTGRSWGVPDPAARWILIVYNSHMKKASLTDTKNNLSALIDEVREGETVLILDRGRPVARLEPVVGDSPDPAGRLAQIGRASCRERAELPGGAGPVAGATWDTERDG